MTRVIVREEPASRATRRRRRRARRILGSVALVAATAAAAVLIRSDVEPEPVASPQVTAPPAPVRGAQTATLLALTLSDDASGQADSLTLFGIDNIDANALLIPAGTTGAIPGEDTAGRIGKALAFGRPSLQEVTVESLLGVEVDRTVVVDDVAIAGLVDALGGIDVTVEERLVSLATHEQIMPLGAQHLDGEQAVRYLTFREGGETELERLPRARKVWDAIVAAASEPARLAEATAALPHLVGDDAGAEALADVLAGFTALEPGRRRTFELPVEPSGDGADTYIVVTEEMRLLIDDVFAGSKPQEDAV